MWKGILLALPLLLTGQYVPAGAHFPVSGGGAPTFTVVQKQIDDTASNDLTISSTASGNLYVYCIGYVSATNQSLTVTDNASTPNTYTLRSTSQSLNVAGTLASQCYDVLNSTHAGATVVSVSGLTTAYSVRVMYEAHRTSGSWAFDIGLGITTGIGTGTNVPGPALIMTGTTGFAVTTFVVGDGITSNPASGSLWTAGAVTTSNGANSIITASAATRSSAVTDGTSADVYAASGVAYK